MIPYLILGGTGLGYLIYGLYKDYKTDIANELNSTRKQIIHELKNQNFCSCRKRLLENPSILDIELNEMCDGNILNMLLEMDVADYDEVDNFGAFLIDKFIDDGILQISPKLLIKLVDGCRNENGVVVPYSTTICALASHPSIDLSRASRSTLSSLFRCGSVTGVSNDSVSKYLIKLIYPLWTLTKMSGEDFLKCIVTGYWGGNRMSVRELIRNWAISIHDPSLVIELMNIWIDLENDETN